MTKRTSDMTRISARLLRAAAIGAALALLAQTPGAYAASALPSPAEFATHAAKDRASLRTALFALQKNARDFADFAEFDSYTRLLPELERLARVHKLDEIYPEVFADTADVIFKGAIKWLDVRSVEADTLLFYAQYARPDSLAYYTDTLSYQIDVEKNNEPLLEKVAERVEALRQMIAAKFPNNTALNQSYGQILTEAGTWSLARTDLTPRQIDFWLQMTASPSGLSSAIERVANNMVSLNAANKDASHAYLDRMLKIRTRAADLPRTPPAVLAQISDSVAELLARMIVLEVAIPQPEFEAGLAVLEARQVRSLAQSVQSDERSLSPAYRDTYRSVTALVSAKLNEFGLAQDAKQFASHTRRVAAALISADLKAEGVYSVIDESKQAWTFTLLRTREDMLYAALSDKNQNATKAFFHVMADPSRGGFVAAQREPDQDSTMRNFTIRFDINSKGEIEIEDLYARAGSRLMKGNKVSEFTDYSANPAKKTAGISGIYTGKIKFLDRKTEVNVALVVTEFEKYTLGRMSIMTNGQVSSVIDYQIGNRASEPMLLLSSGRMQSGNWNQVRGRIDGETFRGTMIAGGRGIVTEEFKLNKSEITASIGATPAR